MSSRALSGTPNTAPRGSPQNSCGDCCAPCRGRNSSSRVAGATPQEFWPPVRRRDSEKGIARCCPTIAPGPVSEAEWNPWRAVPHCISAVAPSCWDMAQGVDTASTTRPRKARVKAALYHDSDALGVVIVTELGVAVVAQGNVPTPGELRRPPSTRPARPV